MNFEFRCITAIPNDYPDVLKPDLLKYFFGSQKNYISEIEYSDS
jgi:hypothetical protein